jgi:hypothetical protein
MAHTAPRPQHEQYPARQADRSVPPKSFLAHLASLLAEPPFGEIDRDVHQDPDDRRSPGTGRVA